MSIASIFRRAEGTWFEELGLTAAGNSTAVLGEYVPVAFAPVGRSGDTVTQAELIKLIGVAEKQAKRDAKAREAERTTTRLASQTAEFEAALAADNASELIEDGAWASFTRGDAAAWSFNLFQFEPRGFTHPGSQVRAEALTKLRGGGLPEVLGYPQRARELASTGLTPREYREHHVALGTKTYDRDSLPTA